MHFTPIAGAPLPEHAASLLRPLGGLSWLDGGLDHGREGRWSFVAAAPVEVRTARWGDAVPWAVFDGLGEGAAAEAGGPLSAEEVPHWIGHVSYDAHWSGRGGARHDRDPRVPVVRLARYEALYAYDHERREGWVVADTELSGEGLAAQLSGATELAARAFMAGPASVPDVPDVVDVPDVAQSAPSDGIPLAVPPAAVTQSGAPSERPSIEPGE